MTATALIQGRSQPDSPGASHVYAEDLKAPWVCTVVAPCRAMQQLSRPQFTKMRASATALALASVLLTSCATAQDAYEGKWVYAERCGLMHAVRLELMQSDNAVKGSWDEGTRLQAASGRVEGLIKADGLHARLCAVDSDPNTCIVTDDVVDVFVRDGDSLVWSKRSAAGTAPYLTLYGENAPQAAARQACDDDEPTNEQGEQR